MSTQKNFNKNIKEIENIHKKIQNDIKNRLEEFNILWKNSDENQIFSELCFCLLTPQSKAKNAAIAIENLLNKNLLFTAPAELISEELNIVRFKNNKAKYIVYNRNLLTKNKKITIKQILLNIKNTKEKREWLVKNIKGMSYKEASHFLRNIGFGKNIAILDRHILKNLVYTGVIKEIPKTITPKIYLKIEKNLINFSKKINISPDYLDFVMWYKEAGEIFK